MIGRAYNVFIDNGLFVAAYYLGELNGLDRCMNLKDISFDDITSDELLQRIAEQMADLVDSTDHYKKMAFGTFQNSSLTQPTRNKMRQEMILSQFKDLRESIGEDKVCVFCGRKTVNKDFLTTRTLLPNFISLTFFNSSNNLKHTDICSHCVLLSLFSFLNVVLASGYTLYQSDSEEFMYYYTEQVQEAHDTEVLINRKSDNLKEVCEKAITLNVGDFYIEQIKFLNGKGVDYRVATVDDYKIRFLRGVRRARLLDEIMNGTWFNKLIHDKTILWDIILERQVCSLELLKLYMREVMEVDKKMEELLVRVAEALLKWYDKKTIIGDIRNTTKIYQYQNLLLNYQEYCSEKGVELFRDTQEFEKVSHFNNKMLLMATVSIIDLKNKNKNGDEN